MSINPTLDEEKAEKSGAQIKTTQKKKKKKKKKQKNKRKKN